MRPLDVRSRWLWLAGGCGLDVPFRERLRSYNNPVRWGIPTGAGPSGSCGCLVREGLSDIPADVTTGVFEPGRVEQQLSDAGRKVVELDAGGREEHGAGSEFYVEELTCLCLFQGSERLTQDRGRGFVAFMHGAEQASLNRGAQHFPAPADKFGQNRAEIALGIACQQNGVTAVFRQAAGNIFGEFGGFDREVGVAGFAVVAADLAADGGKAFFKKAVA